MNQAKTLGLLFRLSLDLNLRCRHVPNTLLIVHDYDLGSYKNNEGAHICLVNRFYFLMIYPIHVDTISME